MVIGPSTLPVFAAVGEDVIAFIDGGADVGRSYMPLHSDALLRRGAVVNAKNEFGQTPSDLARSQGSGGILEL
jgi:hypothetical protein